jgi:hypothetical protein
MGMHRSEGASALLGMDGFVVGAQLEVDGEVWLSVETTAEVVGCEACGTRAIGHGRRVVRVRTCPWAAGQPCWCGTSGYGAAPIRTAT